MKLTNAIALCLFLNACMPEMAFSGKNAQLADKAPKSCKNNNSLNCTAPEPTPTPTPAPTNPPVTSYTVQTPAGYTVTFNMPVSAHTYSVAPHPIGVVGQPQLQILSITHPQISPAD